MKTTDSLKRAKQKFCSFVTTNIKFLLIFGILLYFQTHKLYSDTNSSVTDTYERITITGCIQNMGNGIYSVTYGYDNPFNVEITVPESSSLLKYYDASGALTTTQGMTKFKPGRVENAFSRQFMANEQIVWKVISPNGRSHSLTGNANCTLCQSQAGNIIFPLYDQGNGKTAVVLGLELKALSEANAGDTPSDIIYQINASQKVLVEVIPKAGQLQAVLNLLQNTYGLHYNSDANLTDFIISPGQIIANNLSTIDVYFPISSLTALNNDSQIINFVRVSYPSVKNAGIVTSQGDGAQKSNLVREAYKIVRDGEIVAVDGAGVKIGVISDSYNTQPFTGKSKADVDVENGDLPGLLNPNGYINQVEVLKEYPYGVGFDEGRAMLQILHDIAPGASLAFHTGVVSPRDFELGLKALQEAGCTLVVDDITFPAEPFFGTGRIAQAIEDFTSIPGNSYITSAGNFSNDGYQNIYNPSTNLLQTNFLPEGSTQSVHVFGTNVDGTEDVLQRIKVEPGVYMLVLQWDEDLASQENNSGASDDLDFYLVDDEGRLIVGNNRVNDEGDPTEIMFFQATGTGEANILITNASTNPSANLPFRYIAFRANGLEFLEYDGAPTVSGHAMTEAAITVGAVDYRVAQNPESQFFTSKAGNLSDLSLTEVDISAPDGVNTNVSSIGQDIDGDGFTNFFGTSASAPHVAGAMALLQSVKSSWYPAGLPIDDLELFKQTAVLFGPADLAGAGLIDANNAFKHIASQTSQLIQLVPQEGKMPSAEPFEVTILGKFLPESSTVTVNGEEVPSVKVFFDGAEVDAVLVSDTEMRANIGTFVGNPPLIVNSTPITPGGTDGGESNAVYFFDEGKIAINIIAEDIAVEFGRDIEMSFKVEGLEEGVTFESLGLPEIKFSTPAVFPFPDVNNYIITPSFETPLTEEQLELFQVNFVNGILSVSKKDIIIKPFDATYLYGEAIDIALNYIYNTEGISDNTAFLDAISNAHLSDFFPENTLIQINKLRAVVNEQEIIDLMNNGSWMASERVIQNKLRAVVNGMNLIDLDVQNFIDYQEAEVDPQTNKLRAVVNKLRAVVNGQDLLENKIDLFIGNKLRAVVNQTGLGDEDDQNDYSSIFAVIDAEDGSTETEERSVDKVYAMNLLTGIEVTGNESQYIFPGAYLASIAANFNITYASGRLDVLPATLQISIEDLEIEEGDSPDTSKIISSLTGFVYDETVDLVFPEGLNYYFENNEGNRYEVGDTGEFNIKISAPDNYQIDYVTQGKLLVKKAAEYEYCDGRKSNQSDKDKHKGKDKGKGKHKGKYQDKDKEYDGNRKVYICHKGKTICVSINAIEAHLNHGDILGQCIEDDKKDEHEDLSFVIYPNPVKNYLTIKKNISENSDVYIYDMYGNRYFYKKFKKNNSNEIIVNMKSFPKGIYFIKIITNNDIRTYNVVKN